MAFLTGEVITQADLASLFTSGTYTPTLANMVIGTGGTPINSAKFTFSGFPAGGTLVVEGRIKFGTTGTTLPGASEESMSLPAGYAMIDTTSSVAVLNGKVVLYDVTGTPFDSHLIMLTSTTIGFRLPQVSGTNISSNTAMTATVPFAWAINDEIHYRYAVRCTGP